MCVSALVFAISLALAGDGATFHDWGAVRQGPGGETIWRWRGELLCSGGEWVE